MENGFRLNRAAAGWVAVALLLALPALANRVGASAAADWQPGLALHEPWRWWSAAWVHFSRMHLTLNLAGTLLVVGLGLASPVGPRAAMAWLVAWPLTHLGLLLKPDLLHYGGLSGVLHAGVAVVAVELFRDADRHRRWIGAIVSTLLLAKLLFEAPWGPALRYPAGWDIAVAPLAHATGAMQGVLCALLLAKRPFDRQPRMRRTNDVVE